MTIDVGKKARIGAGFEARLITNTLFTFAFILISACSSSENEEQAAIEETVLFLPMVFFVMAEESIYTFDVIQLEAASTSRYVLYDDCDTGRTLNWSEVIARWRDEKTFRRFFVSLLKDAQYSAYFFETPPVNVATMDREFEFVLVDSKALAGVRANPSAFANQFQTAGVNAAVVQFSNLGGDATLVVPCPHAPNSAYAHLRDFTHYAPIDQQHEFWRRTGDAIQRCLGAYPTWVSTSGLGVFWLHMRLDSTPKYYTHVPYRKQS